MLYSLEAAVLSDARKEQILEKLAAHPGWGEAQKAARSGSGYGMSLMKNGKIKAFEDTMPAYDVKSQINKAFTNGGGKKPAPAVVPPKGPNSALAMGGGGEGAMKSMKLKPVGR